MRLTRLDDATGRVRAWEPPSPGRIDDLLGRHGLVVFEANDPAAKPVVADLFARELDQRPSGRLAREGRRRPGRCSVTRRKSSRLRIASRSFIWTGRAAARFAGTATTT